ncbi:MAG TPA: GAF domain-containing sensor histidine kinase [Caulobacteraceae bacterium]
MEARSKVTGRFESRPRPDPSDEARLVLEEGVARLSATADIDSFLADLLRATRKLLGGESASIWRRDAQAPVGYRLEVSLETETVLRAEGRSGLRPNLSGAGLWQEAAPTPWVELRRVGVDGLPCQRIIARDGLADAEDTLLLQTGVRSSVIIDLVLADISFGVLIVRLAHERPVLDQHRQLIDRLAQRAAMALHLSGFAGAFREASAARELQAATAKARAEKLALANALLRESSERLGAVEDLDTFLGRVLLTMYEVVGGHSGTLWLVDPDSPDHYRIHHVVEDGRVVAGAQSSHPRREIGSTPTPKRKRDSRMYGPTSKPHLLDLEANDGLMHEDERLYLLGLGVRRLLSVPLGLGDRVLGRFTIRLTDTRHILEEELDIIQALAGQAAVALNLTRLAEEAKQAAVGREREVAERSRADTLHRANEVLRAMLERLSEQQDLPAFLGDALKMCAREMDAAGAGIWIRRGQGDHGLLISWHGGEIRRPAEGDYLSRLTAMGHLDPDLSRGQIAFVKLADFDDLIDEWGPTLRHAIETDQVRTAAQVPMFIGDRWLGTLVFRHTSESPDYPPERRELALAFGNQIALALEMQRLAAAAGEAALSEERASAARQRTEAAERTAETLRASLDMLAAEPELESFLGYVLRAANKHLNVRRSTLWLYDPEQSAMRLHMMCHEGVVTVETGAPRVVITDDEWPFWRRLIEKGGPLTFDDATRNPHLAEVQDRMRRFGVRSLLMVPLMLGSEVLGSVGFHNTERESWTEDEISLARALGHQATLALQLTRLAAKAREAALSEERASAARQRTEAAERTAETLRASLDMLAAEPELEGFLGYVLRSANTHLDVRRSTLWLYDAEQGVNRLHMMCHEGAVTVETGTPRVVITAGEWPFWRRLIEKGGPMAFDDAANNPDLPVGAVRDRMRRFGVRSLLLAPLMLGSEVLGAVGFHNTERESWTEDEISLARTLSHQATLALQLTRLAAKAREGAVLQERNRLAREIHDTLAQGFAAIRMQLELGRRDPAAAPEALDRANKIAAENLVEARRSMAVLTAERPSLIASLSAAIEGVRRLGQTQVVAQLDSAPEPPTEVAHELLRICQEAMLNAVRHAEASTVRVTLSAMPGPGVRVAVADDGKGFDPGVVTKGFGLAGLRDRASAIDADLTIVSEPGAGTQVIAVWTPT